MPAKYDKPIPVLLLTDFYKIFHRGCYNPKTEQLVEYLTPRMSRVKGIDYVVELWLQGVLKKYLIDKFAVTFFDRPWEEVRAEYVEYISATFDKGIAQSEIEAFKEVHAMGYLPILIRAVPEGTRVPIGCPMIEFRCTDPRMFWLPSYLETLCSCNLWLPMTAATIADHNRSMVDEWYDKTVEDNVPRHSAAGNFSMRGMGGEEAAIMADAGHLLSFSSTATVPTAWSLRNFYNAPLTICKGTPSLEHSVMESYGEEHELEAFEHISTEVRPNGALSMISDTWDLWRVLTEYLPKLKGQLVKRDGRVVIRPDSGNPIDIVCGLPHAETTLEHAAEYFKQRAMQDCFELEKGSECSVSYCCEVEGEKVTCTCAVRAKEDGNFDAAVTELTSDKMSSEDKGVVRLLWELVGGTVNSKGFRVLEEHFGVIYGDAITFDSGSGMYSRLAENGYAANNIILGFGSFTYQYVTRDTFGFALKVTHGIVDGVETEMFKDPITDHGKHSAGKKSQKGMCIVRQDEDGTISYTDHHTFAESDAPGNLLRPVFKNGELLVDEDFETIRRRLHPNF